MPRDSGGWRDLDDEIRKADAKYGPFTSTHEGYGVLAEEVAELLDAIRSNRPEHVRKEAIQVAAVAMRIIHALHDDPFRVRSGMQ
jgi:NTP pyrophosphatase (non-canonical NTP hydrolase)